MTVLNTDFYALIFIIRKFQLQLACYIVHFKKNLSKTDVLVKQNIFNQIKMLNEYL